MTKSFTVAGDPLDTQTELNKRLLSVPSLLTEEKPLIVSHNPLVPRSSQPESNSPNIPSTPILLNTSLNDIQLLTTTSTLGPTLDIQGASSQVGCSTSETNSPQLKPVLQLPSEATVTSFMPSKPESDHTLELNVAVDLGPSTTTTSLGLTVHTRPVKVRRPLISFLEPTHTTHSDSNDHHESSETALASASSPSQEERLGSSTLPSCKRRRGLSDVASMAVSLRKLARGGKGKRGKTTQ